MSLAVCCVADASNETLIPWSCLCMSVKRANYQHLANLMNASYNLKLAN